MPLSTGIKHIVVDSLSKLACKSTPTEQKEMYYFTSIAVKGFHLGLFESSRPIGTRLGLCIKYGTFCMFMQPKVIYRGLRSSEVELKDRLRM